MLEHLLVRSLRSSFDPSASATDASQPLDHDDGLHHNSTLHDHFGPMTDGGHGGISSLGVILVAAFTLLVNLIFFVPAYWNRRRRRRLLAQTMAARTLASALDQDNDQRHNSLAAAQTKSVRYANIESWVVSRTIVSHDHLCTKLKKATAQGRRAMYTKKRTSTVDTVGATDEEWGIEESSSEGQVKKDDDGENEDAVSTASDSARGECPICFDDLRTGDVASWSLDPSCKHVFHHACIKEWLLKHEGCPFCRATFLPIDDAAMQQSSHSSASRSGNNSMLQVNMLLMAHNERTRSCFCCADHGIVYLPQSRPLSITDGEWKALTDRGQRRPPLEELRRLRSSDGPNTDIEKSNDNGEGENEDIVESGDEEDNDMDQAGAPAGSETGADLTNSVPAAIAEHAEQHTEEHINHDDDIEEQVDDIESGGAVQLQQQQDNSSEEESTPTMIDADGRGDEGIFGGDDLERLRSDPNSP